MDLYTETALYGTIYAIMKSLDINEIEIKDVDLNINNKENLALYITKDITNKTTKFTLKETKGETNE